MRRMGAEARWQIGSQRIVPGMLREFDRLRADLATARQIADVSSQCMRHQLMAIADAEQRQFDIHRIADPASHTFTPCSALGHHGSRAGNHRPCILRAVAAALRRPPHPRYEAAALEPRAKSEPMREVAMAGTDDVRRPAGAYDQYWFHAGIAS